MTNPNRPASRIPWAPPLYLAAIVGGVVLGIVYPLPWPRGPVAEMIFAIGLILIAGGVFLAGTTVHALRKAGTAVLPTRPSTHLVTKGPYSVSRNPIYLAGAVIVIAVGLVAGNAWLIVLAVPAGLVLTRISIVPEERHLAAQFGKRYRDYAARVRRWI
jgi:protein-S-isoprenylcysteine O-methyltransferase Ste14